MRRSKIAHQHGRPPLPLLGPRPHLSPHEVRWTQEDPRGLTPLLLTQSGLPVLFVTMRESQQLDPTISAQSHPESVSASQLESEKVGALSPLLRRHHHHWITTVLQQAQ